MTSGYRWVSQAGEGTASPTSPATAVAAVAGIRTTQVPTRGVLGKAMPLAGTVAPATARVAVQLRYGSRGKWHHADAATVRDGRVTASVTPTRRGQVWIRLVAAAGVGYRSGTSAAQSATVR